MKNRKRIFLYVGITALACGALWFVSKTHEVIKTRTSAPPAPTKALVNLSPEGSGVIAPLDARVQKADIEELKHDLSLHSDDELEQISTEAKQDIVRHHLIEKANRNKLSEAEAARLSLDLDRSSTAEVVLIDRKLESLRKKYL